MRNSGRSCLAGRCATAADGLFRRPAPHLRGVAASLAASAWLFGCTVQLQQPLLAEVTRACLAHNRGFTDAWGCIQARYAAAEPDRAEPRLKMFLRLGDSLAMQVAARTLSEASARARLAANLPGERTTIVDGVSQLVRSLTIARP